MYVLHFAVGDGLQCIKVKVCVVIDIDVITHDGHRLSTQGQRDSSGARPGVKHVGAV